MGILTKELRLKEYVPDLKCLNLDLEQSGTMFGGPDKVSDHLHCSTDVSSESKMTAPWLAEMEVQAAQASY